jgi:ceramide glucosyltransferase
MKIFLFFACLTLLGLVGYGFQVWSIRMMLRNKATGKGKEKMTVSKHLPAISVLKPLKGLDDNLFDNLESVCLQVYPKYEIIFSLQDHNDPAYKVARKIKDKYPEKDITIVVERCNIGLNPKVNNLIPAYKIAKYEHILISDSNVMVDRNYLNDIVKHTEDPDVGLVSNIIKGVNARSVGSIFENLHLNSFIMGSVCFLDRFLRMPCVVGKSMLMRKKDLEAIGGFKAVKDVLAEDYIIGKKMNKSGKKVILSKHIIKNVNEYWGIRKFLNRHARWGKLRWRIGGMRYFSELLGNTVFMSFLPILFWEPSKITLTFAACISSTKILGDFYIGRKIKAKMNCLLYLLSPIKDLIIGMLWFVPILSNTVIWRGNRYIIGKDSLLSPCPDSGILYWKYKLADAVKAKFAVQ